MYALKDFSQLSGIAELWKEYNIGLNGHWPVRVLNEKYVCVMSSIVVCSRTLGRYGKKWRKFNNQRQKYNKRTYFYNWILDQIEAGVDEHEAVMELQRKLEACCEKGKGDSWAKNFTLLYKNLQGAQPRDRSRA